MSQPRGQRQRVLRRETRLNYPPTEEALVISVSDWDGLIRRITNLQADLRKLPVAYSIFFGVGVTAGLSLAPILISGLPTWVMMLYVAICAAALALGIGLLIADSVLSKQRSIQIDQLANEMTDIRDRYLESRALAE